MSAGNPQANYLIGLFMVNRTLKPKGCAHCGETFLTWKSHQRYCSRSCGRKALWASGAMGHVLAIAKKASPFQQGFTPWNKGVPWPLETRKKMGVRSREAFMAIRGGNGQGMSKSEAIVSQHLLEGWVYNYVIPVGMGRLNGYPTHYKIDFAWPHLKMALEVDGSSPSSLVRQEQDRRKEAWLSAQGWSVFRVTNAQVAARSTISLWKVLPTTLQQEL